MTENLRNNTAKNRYELEVSGNIVFADYKLENGTLYIKYVETPVALRGAGAAGKLMQYVAEQARANKYRIVPICGYATSWLRRHGEFNDIVDR